VKTRILFLAILLVIVVGMVALAVTPSKVSPQANTTIYFGTSTFGATATPADTLIWDEARSFSDTGYTTAVFVTGATATGTLVYAVLDDSSVIITTSAATDSGKVYSYQVLLKKH